MALAVSILKYSGEVDPDTVYLKVVPSGAYASGGDTLNLNPGTWSDPAGKGVIGSPLNPPAVNPTVEAVVAMTGVGLGSTAQVVPSTALATYKLQIFPSGGNQGVELGAGNYAAGILAGYWVVKVVF